MTSSGIHKESCLSKLCYVFRIFKEKRANQRELSLESQTIQDTVQSR